MCKVNEEAAFAFRFGAPDDALPCYCGNPAVFAVAWKFKRKPGYLVFPLCDSCGVKMAKELVKEDAEFAALVQGVR